jgi:uncharacterized protein DUF748
VQVLIGFVALLVGIRAVLPIVVERYVNKTLDELEGYSGHIEDVDLALIRGAYVIEGVRIVKTGGKVPVPFFSASQIDLSVQWGALLDGAIVSEIDVQDPKVNFVTAPSKDEKNSKDDEKPKGEDEPKGDEKPKGEAKSGGTSSQEEQVAPSSNWTDVVKDLVPFDINRFSIQNGEVHYRDFGSEPNVDIYVQDIQAEARNLTNSEERAGSLVATFDGRATAMRSGRISFKGQVDPYAKEPTFQTAFKLNGLDLPQLNPYLRAYANVDVEKGTFSLDAEFAASQGKFEGYVKPFIDHLDVLRWQSEKESFPNKVWQALVEGTNNLIKDKSRDRTAARIPFEGRFDQPKIGIWSAIGSVLRNGFIEALRRGLEGSIDMRKLSGSDAGAGEK